MRIALLLGSLALTGCSLTVDYTGTYFECGENDLCPDGYVCKQQVCIPTEPAPTTCTSGVAAGVRHSCAIRDTDGSVWCWGANNQGQLGDNTTADSNLPVQAVGIVDAAQVVTGLDFSCAIVGGDRHVECWGANDDGQLGDGSATGSRTPVQAGGLTGITSLAVGYQHTCALGAGGTVSCWGSNNFGQLGDGTQTGHRSPATVNGVTATSITATDDSTCAVDNNQLKCWGENSSGMFMTGTTDDPLTPTVGTLVSDVAGASLGGDHLCIFTTAGAVKCAGMNDHGELGDGTITGSTAMPVDTLLPAKIVSLSLGYHHSCAIDDQGGSWCWGDNNGKLAMPPNVFGTVTTPTRTVFEPVESISAGEDHTCARLQTGAIACAGFNGRGQLGNGTRLTQASPRPVSDLTDVSAVTVGGDFSCALQGGGAVQCWGNGLEGELGDGAFHLKPKASPAIMTGATQLVAGGDHVCAVSNAGTVSCWGRNSSGQLGAGGQGSRGTPLEIPGLTGVLQLALGDDHSCALTASTVTCWGTNSSGQLGATGINPTLVPTEVPGLLDGPAVAISAGGSHTCAIDSLGEVQCWGANSLGQLGDGTQIGNSTPVKVQLASGGNLAGAEEIAARGSTSFARVGGKIFGWGFGCSDRLGSNNAVCSATTRAVEVANIDNAADLAIGYTSSCSLRADATLSCWGQNYFGQMGDGTYSGNIPVPLVGLANVVDVAVGGEHACAALGDGTVSCWGADFDGELGDNVLDDRGPNFVRVTCE